MESEAMLLWSPKPKVMATFMQAKWMLKAQNMYKCIHLPV